jgi:hypothetical protein
MLCALRPLFAIQLTRGLLHLSLTEVPQPISSRSQIVLLQRRGIPPHLPLPIQQPTAQSQP